MVSETDLPQAVTPEEARFVDVAVDACDAAFAGILPQGDVALVGQHRLLVEIHGNHQLVVVEFAHEVPVIEVAEGIHEWFLAIGPLHHMEEGEQRVAELVDGKSTERLHVDHRYEVLLAGQALGGEVVQLFLQGRLRAEEVVGAHFQSVAMSQIDVALELRVDAVAAFGGLQIHVGHLGILADGLPEHVALISAQVDAVHVTAGILTLQEGIVVGIVQSRVAWLRGSGAHLLGLGLGLRFLLHHLRGFRAGAALLFAGFGAEGLARCKHGHKQYDDVKYIASVHRFRILSHKITLFFRNHENDGRNFFYFAPQSCPISSATNRLEMISSHGRPSR